MARRYSCFLSYIAIVAWLTACGYDPATTGTAQTQITTQTTTPPQITTQPTSQSVSVGQTATFSVAATSTTPLQYQWRKSGTAIVGATGSSYTTSAAVSGDNGSSFTVVVTNATGSMTSNAATLTVTAAPTAPQITTQPVNQTVSVGQTATFHVVATGTAPLQYQWQKNGTAIAAATGSSYTAPAAVSGDNGSSFTVVVTNATGSMTSNAATLTATATAAAAGTDVVTYKYDVMRTGQNLTESALTPSNVTSATFGKLRNLMVDGLVDAQPLYLSRLTVAGAAHNVVFVATEHDAVYAFDADTGTILWQVSLISGGETTSDDRGCGQVTPEIGITSTPVIDRNAGTHGTIYVVAMTKDASSNYHQRLHALDITTGHEMTGSPTEIAAMFGATTFAPGQYKERAALLLNNGTIYTTWASHCDDGPYGGWIIALSESTLAITSVLNVARDASGSGYASQGPSIWMSVKISSSGGNLAVADYFAMSGEIDESTGDGDLGSGGVMLLPDVTDANGTVRHLAVGAGKDGNIYVVNRDNMGKFTSVGNNIWQELHGVLGNGVWATPAYFNSSIYYGPQGGSLKAFSVTNALLSSSPMSQTSTHFAYPGTFPVVSANGTGNAIVWAYENTSPAVLHAYAATNLATELYNSNQASDGRDHFGAGNKYIAPVVADGKVFVATTNSVAVFGLLP